MTHTVYDKALQLLKESSTPYGFLASKEAIGNYARVWSRDGVICGLAALLSQDQALISTFERTLHTLAQHQHANGMIPSNVQYKDNGTSSVSFGGLCGRVDTISWYIIGVCHYLQHTNKQDFAREHEPVIHKGFACLKTWEFNDRGLMYVPRSGNWADEYITEGYTLYDQLLRLWALKSFRVAFQSDQYLVVEKEIQKLILLNYKKKEQTAFEPYHPKAYQELEPSTYYMASLTPSGYQQQFDAFGNSLLLLLDILEEQDREVLIAYCEELRMELSANLLPAFWPVIEEFDWEWPILEQNCKYEFRNHPYEFHNGGTWPMVNGFYQMALSQFEKEQANAVAEQINRKNSELDFSFYENFNSETGKPNGVPYCAWSAAATVLMQKYSEGNRLIF